MKIVEYQPRYRADFVRFNRDWIVDNFGRLEESDLESFAHVETDLSRGAMIYFAVESETVLATCMAKPMGRGTWEICKLASNKHRPHRGCGSAVFGAAVRWAEAHGAERLFILSNRKLKAALHIYEKFGFHEIKLEDYSYDRGDIAFERRISHDL
jgi:GNAT superfamily N-acetyltransferase